MVDEVVINNTTELILQYPRGLYRKMVQRGIPAGEFWAVDPRAKTKLGAFTQSGIRFPNNLFNLATRSSMESSESKWTTFPGRTVHKATEKNGPAIMIMLTEN